MLPPMIEQSRTCEQVMSARRVIAERWNALCLDLAKCGCMTTEDRRDRTKRFSDRELAFAMDMTLSGDVEWRDIKWFRETARHGYPTGGESDWWPDCGIHP